MILRKRMPDRLRPAWEAFHAQAQKVEAARRALLGCLPIGRVDPAPVPVGLDLVRDELHAVAKELKAWRVAEVEADWRAVREAVAEAERAIPRALRTATTTRELEELLDAVGEVVEPLDAWADAEQSWLRLRKRTRRWRPKGL
ncbi:MAG: hypothetical protein GEU81_11120 [Nitriliruptorales bacterium]|nr:hypothetical protein [Nitriliruptorales bacterium]